MKRLTQKNDRKNISNRSVVRENYTIGFESWTEQSVCCSSESTALVGMPRNNRLEKWIDSNATGASTNDTRRRDRHHDRTWVHSLHCCVFLFQDDEKTNALIYQERLEHQTERKNERAERKSRERERDGRENAITIWMTFNRGSPSWTNRSRISTKRNQEKNYLSLLCDLLEHHEWDEIWLFCQFLILLKGNGGSFSSCFFPNRALLGACNLLSTSVVCHLQTHIRA